MLFRSEDKETGGHFYIVSDLGGTFGKLGSNDLPIFWRLGRSINRPSGYAKTGLIKGVKNGRVKLAYTGKHSSIFNNITIEQARWLADLLLQLHDEQIGDAFRAASYSPDEINILTGAVKKRINELDSVTSNIERVAKRVLIRTRNRPRRVQTRRH